MKIAICDDEQFWRTELFDLIKEYHDSKRIECSISQFSNGTELLLSHDKFDIIFMDYMMNDIDGLEIAHKIRALNNRCAIIFASSYPDIAIDTFEVAAFRFLTKPINKEKLFKALDDHRRTLESDDFIILKNRDSETIIRSSDIIFCEAWGRRTTIHTTKENIECSKKIKEIEKILTYDFFFRCHKAFLVSFKYISSFNNTTLFFENGEKAFISRNYLPTFRASFQKYVLKISKEKM